MENPDLINQLKINNSDSNDNFELFSILNEIFQAIIKENPKNQFDFICKYAKSRIDVSNLSNIEKAVLLCDAASNGNFETLKDLLNKGLDPNLSDYDRRHPLHLAAEDNYLDCVQLLVDFGADINAQDRWGSTPVKGAILFNNLEVVDYLVSKGARGAKARNDDARAAELIESTTARNISELKSLLDSGVDPNSTDYNDRSALHVAVDLGFEDIIMILLDAGANFNLPDRWGITPQTAAINHENVAISNLFLKQNQSDHPIEANVEFKKSSLRRFSTYNEDAVDNNAFFPNGPELIRACKLGLANWVNILLDKGVDIDQCDVDNCSPIHFAAEEGHLDVVKLLVKRGANINAKDRLQNSPFMVAINNTHQDVSEYLKDNGCDSQKIYTFTSQQTFIRKTRNQFDEIGSIINIVRKSDIMPIEGLIQCLQDAGFNLTRHESLFQEINSIARDSNDPKIMKILDNDSQLEFSVKNFKLPLVDCPIVLEGKFFLQIDFADLVLSDISEHNKMGDLKNPNTTQIKKIVLEQLELNNWNAFKQNILQIQEEVLLNSPNDGENAQQIPELKNADPEKFAISVCTVDGQTINFGDFTDNFSVQSIGKTFAQTLALMQHGHELVHTHVGQEPSGRAFNDFTLTRHGLPQNPVTNAGSIMTCSLLSAAESDVEKKLKPIKDLLGRISGNIFQVDDMMDVYSSEQSCAQNNYALANFMKARNIFPSHISSHTHLWESVNFQLRMCSLKVSTNLLANAAATQANFGVCPLTSEVCISESEVKQTLNILNSCGMYDQSGEWACTIGMPAKSGVSGGIFVVVPGVLGMCVWSPKLDNFGNSVRAIRFCKLFSEKFKFGNLDLLFRKK